MRPCLVNDEGHKKKGYKKRGPPNLGVRLSLLPRLPDSLGSRTLVTIEYMFVALDVLKHSKPR